MHTVPSNGADMPALGFGTYLVSEADCRHMVPHVLKLGYRHIDTAQLYRNEAAVGEGIRASGVPRAEIFVTTKVWPTEYAPAKFARSVDESLKRLGMDYVDLLLLHWPNRDVPLEEQIFSLNQARTEGKTRHIGVSNFNTALMQEAVRLSDAPIVSNQVEYHPYLDQSAVLEVARNTGMSLTAYFAMAEGRVLKEPLLQDIASRQGKTVAQVVLRWLVQQRDVVALSKTVSEQRAAENLAIFDFELSEDEMAAIHGLRRGNGRIISPGGLAPEWD